MSDWDDYQKAPRYTVGLQKDKEPNCYVDFAETNTLSEAKEKAEKKTAETGKATIVYDRKEGCITHKVAGTAPSVVTPPPTTPEPEPKKRGRPRKT